MRLKLDLHPIFNDAQKIETALQNVIDEAVAKRAVEVEVIPGKGSGALKKTVIRFLDRPDVKARYHRVEKDSDNWGRLFIHFRPPARVDERPARATPIERTTYRCFCCDAAVSIPVDREAFPEERVLVSISECPSCGSPNRVTLRLLRRGDIAVEASSGYE